MGWGHDVHLRRDAASKIRPAFLAEDELRVPGAPASRRPDSRDGDTLLIFGQFSFVAIHTVEAGRR